MANVQQRFRPGMDSDYREYSGYAQRDKGDLDRAIANCAKLSGKWVKGFPKREPLPMYR